MKRRARPIAALTLWAMLALAGMVAGGGSRRAIARHGAAALFTLGLIGLGVALRRLHARAELERVEAELARELESLESR